MMQLRHGCRDTLETDAATAWTADIADDAIKINQSYQKSVRNCK